MKWWTSSLSETPKWYSSITGKGDEHKQRKKKQTVHGVFKKDMRPSLLLRAAQLKDKPHVGLVDFSFATKWFEKELTPRLTNQIQAYEKPKKSKKTRKPSIEKIDEYFQSESETDHPRLIHFIQKMCTPLMYNCIMKCAQDKYDDKKKKNKFRMSTVDTIGAEIKSLVLFC